MKIKVAILEKDRGYLSRIVSFFGTKFSDKLEVYSFTDPEVALGMLKSAKIDVFLANDSFEINAHDVPNRCAFAYLVDFNGVEMINEQRAICKFQKVDLLYKQILSVYAEKASAITGFKTNAEGSETVAFFSASGGVGSSTMAAACAMRFAAKGKKVLYLNLEKFGSADVFFSGQGQFDMTDVIFALKSKKTNLPMKLESCVKQDSSGVFFYSQAKIALDMMELNAEDMIRLIAELNLTGGYDYIVLDMDFDVNSDFLKVYHQVQALVMVGNGSVSSNIKTERAYLALSTLEQNSDAPLTGRLSFIYNNVNSKTGSSISVTGLEVRGGAPHYASANERQVVEQLASTMDLFDTIL